MESLVNHVQMTGLDSENNWREGKRKSHGPVCVLKGPSCCWQGNGWELGGFAVFQKKDGSGLTWRTSSGKDNGQQWTGLIVDMAWWLFGWEWWERENRSQDDAWFRLGQVTEPAVDKDHRRRVWFAVGGNEFISGHAEFEVPGINSLHLLVFSKVHHPCEMTGTGRLT